MLPKSGTSVVIARPDWTEDAAEVATKSAWDEGLLPDTLLVPAELLPSIREAWKKAATKHPTGELFWVSDFGVLKVVTHAVA